MREFEARYNEMGQSATTPQAREVKKGKASGLKKLIRETQSSDSDEDIAHFTPAAPPDLAKPWRADFMKFIDMSHAGGKTSTWREHHSMVGRTYLLIFFHLSRYSSF
jgi:hypothetical protein